MTALAVLPPVSEVTSNSVSWLDDVPDTLAQPDIMGAEGPESPPSESKVTELGSVL